LARPISTLCCTDYQCAICCGIVVLSQVGNVLCVNCEASKQRGTNAHTVLTAKYMLGVSRGKEEDLY